MRLQLSVKQYAIAISLLTIGLLLAFGWVSHQQIQQSNADIREWKKEVSIKELSESLLKLQRQSLVMAQSFANWQEIRQQLNKPDYYPYWKMHRAKSAPMLPQDVLDVAIYDADGKILRKLPGQKILSQLPFPVPMPCVSSRVGGDSVLTVFRPVRQPLSDTVLGYVGVQLPLFEHLLETSHFSFVDKVSLSLDIPQDTETDLIESQQYFSFQLMTDIFSQALEKYEKDTDNRLLTIGIFLSIILYLYLVHVVAAPITLLMEHIKRLRDDKTFQPQEMDEPLALKEMDDIRILLNRYHAKLDDIHHDLDRSNKELWQLAHHDPLTGILNRRAFNDYWESILQQSHPASTIISLMIFDVNHFKAINDSYGHRTGDNVLKGVVDSIKRISLNGQQLFRLGGDEFACIFVGIETDQVLSLAQQCCQAVDEYDFYALGIHEPVKISIGIANVDAGNSDQVVDLIRKTDIAIYQAKRPGSSGIVVYSDEISALTKNLYSSKTYNAVFQAIENGEGLTMFYQPIVKLDSEKICYYEALVRIRTEDDWIYPDSIFPIIEARNLEQDLDRAVIRQVTNDLADNRIPEGTGVSVNLSAASVARHDVSSWLQPLEKYISTHDIVVEITETALITQLEKATINLEALSEKGFRVALDDFGSGYSSIRYLSCMPVDIVKFDITLIQDLANEKQRPIISGLSDIISSLGYSLVAEGIEDQSTRDNAIAAGFVYAQGYMFGRPELHPVLQGKKNDIT